MIYLTFNLLDSNMPKPIRILSGFLIFAWSIFLIIGLVEFITKPFLYASSLAVLNILYIVSAIGLRRMKRWSVYLFLAPIFILYGFLLINSQDITQEVQRLVIPSLIPSIYCLIVFPYWKKFE